MNSNYIENKTKEISHENGYRKAPRFSIDTKPYHLGKNDYINQGSRSYLESVSQARVVNQGLVHIFSPYEEVVL